MPVEASERFVRSASALPDAVAHLRHEVVAYAERVGANEAATENVALAVGEALNNVAVHAYVDRDVGPVRVEAWADDSGCLYVCVVDDGRGMVPRTDSPGLGLGIPLMAQVADDVRVATCNERPGTKVSLKFSLAAEDVAV